MLFSTIHVVSEKICLCIKPPYKNCKFIVALKHTSQGNKRKSKIEIRIKVTK